MSSDHDRGTFPATGGWFLIGPTVELRLPFGLGIEVDALYRKVSFPSSASWEFPILGKWRTPGKGPVRPFIAGGVAFQRNDILRAAQAGPGATASGFVMGAGIEARLKLIRLAPEVRYVRWTSHFPFRGADLTNRNQFDLLVGVTF